MRFLASFLFAVSCLPAQVAPDPAKGERRGTCILAGGGKLPPALFARFHELAGGKDAVVVLLPTASQTADDRKENEDTLRLFRERLPGASISLLHTRDRQKADDEAFTAPLRTATGVWIGGGVQKRLADAYLGTRVEKELMALLARGGVIGGTSAGTAIQTRTMIQEGDEEPVLATGFDFVPGAISDQHFLKRGRLPRLVKALSLHPGLVGIGVDESTAAEICGDTLRVVGNSKVVVALPARNGHVELVTELAPGETADLGAWRRWGQERATWSLDVAFVPRIDAGALLLGSGDVARRRFVDVAGGRTAKVVLLGLDRSDLVEERNRLVGLGVTDATVFRVPAEPEVARQITAALAEANAAIVKDDHLHASLAIVAMPGTGAMREALRGVLTRGGSVWANGAAGEVVAGPWVGNASAPEGIGYEHGLALLPGTMIVERRLQHAEVGGAPVGPITDGAPHEWIRRHATRMPRILGIHVESAAIVRGSVLEVLGELPSHVLPTKVDGKAGDARERITLEPGARWDLVAQQRL